MLAHLHSVDKKICFTVLLPLTQIMTDLISEIEARGENLQFSMYHEETGSRKCRIDCSLAFILNDSNLVFHRQTQTLVQSYISYGNVLFFLNTFFKQLEAFIFRVTLKCRLCKPKNSFETFVLAAVTHVQISLVSTAESVNASRHESLDSLFSLRDYFTRELDKGTLSKRCFPLLFFSLFRTFSFKYRRYFGI